MELKEAINYINSYIIKGDSGEVGIIGNKIEAKFFRFTIELDLNKDYGTDLILFKMVDKYKKIDDVEIVGTEKILINNAIIIEIENDNAKKETFLASNNLSKDIIFIKQLEGGYREWLIDGTKKATQFVGNEAARYYLNGIHINFNYNLMVATNGHIAYFNCFSGNIEIIKSQYNIEAKNINEQSFILATKSIKIFNNAMNDQNLTRIELYYNYIYIKGNGRSILIKNIEADYPNYMAIIPNNKRSLFVNLDCLQWQNYELDKKLNTNVTFDFKQSILRMDNVTFDSKEPMDYASDDDQDLPFDTIEMAADS
jgi:hypothetical protein